MIERRRRKLPYLFIAVGATVSSLLTYAMYESFVVHAISGPTAKAAEQTANELDPNGEVAIDRKPELPVWPPPSVTTPVDPASNPMQGALPMRIDWPDASSSPAKPR